MFPFGSGFHASAWRRCRVFYVRPPWGCLPLPWRCGPPYIFSRMNGNTQAFPWKRGESWLWKAPLRLFPENPCCFARMVPGGCTRFPPVTGPALWRQGNATGSGERRIRFRRRAVPASLTGSGGGTCTASSPESGWMSIAGTGRETGAAVSGLFPCGSGKGLLPCSGRAPLRMMRPGR